MSIKLVSRSLLAVAMAAGIASAQLLNSKSIDVIRVEKTGFSAGRIDSLTQALALQQFQGKKVNDETMTQVRYAVIDNLVGQELVKLECKKQGIKPIIGCEVYVAPGSRFDKEAGAGEDRYNHLVLLAEVHGLSLGVPEPYIAFGRLEIPDRDDEEVALPDPHPLLDLAGDASDAGLSVLAHDADLGCSEELVGDSEHLRFFDVGQTYTGYVLFSALKWSIYHGNSPFPPIRLPYL